MEFISFKTLNDENYQYVMEDEECSVSPHIPSLISNEEKDFKVQDVQDVQDVQEETQDVQEETEDTEDTMLYIDSLFMCSGFMRMQEDDKMKETIISRLYASNSGLYISIKCGLPYRCTFVYDKTINYVYPNVIEINEYVSDHNNLETNLLQSYKFIEKNKIQPETFEVVIYREKFPDVGKSFLQLFTEKFEKCINYSVTENNIAIIITFAPLKKENTRLSIESLVKFFNPSW
jgi:hypothetical protein